MAVYKKTYRRYEGALTPAWSRFLILPRYSFAEMRESRFYTTFFLGTMLPPLAFALIIYLRHNATALDSFGLDPSRILNIDADFFLNFLGLQAMLAFFVAVFRGPGLVSPDLANNALPLYLSRPFSRTEYVLGRMSVLAILLSVMTWVPGLLLFALQGYLDGWEWVSANPRTLIGLFVGSWIWIFLLSLLVLALSAWVKWKPVAGGVLFMILFVGAGVANAFNQILDSRWGHLINLSHLVGMVWVWLFDRPMQMGAGAAFFRVQPGEALPMWTVWCSLGALCGLCLWLLAKKVRGMEVVT
jgi:ABC-2 type transport system permease protein